MSDPLTSMVSAQLSHNHNRTLGLFDEMREIIAREYSPHPFRTAITPSNLRKVLSEYFTMSRAFPYIQASAHWALVAPFVRNGEEIPSHVDTTAVVAAFLVWDEMGGHRVLMTGGEAMLPQILNTKQFHGNILKEDVLALLGGTLKPGNSPATNDYLNRLRDGLSAESAVIRVANMIAFEMHAGNMITELWNSLRLIFPASANSLAYFHMHVGGDNPAESHHIAMSTRMIEQVVEARYDSALIEAFSAAYNLSFAWCEAITRLQGD